MTNRKLVVVRTLRTYVHILSDLASWDSCGEKRPERFVVGMIQARSTSSAVEDASCKSGQERLTRRNCTHCMLYPPPFGVMLKQNGNTHIRRQTALHKRQKQLFADMHAQW